MTRLRRRHDDRLGFLIGNIGGEAGRRWCERIWTVLATCAQQGRSAFDFLYHSIAAHFKNQASPFLLPNPP